jgi:hypothetical protein
MPIAGQAPIGSGSTPHFALFAERTAATARLLDRFEDLLEPDLRPPFRTGGLWLVRPDGYAACSAAEPEIVAKYLNGNIQANTQQRG